MGRVIKIDWYQVHQISKKFFDEAENMKKIIDKTKETFSSITTSGAWKGLDANRFIENSDKCIEQITKEYQHLLEWSDYLTKASLRYSDNVEESMKRLRSIEEMLYELNGNSLEGNNYEYR